MGGLVLGKGGLDASGNDAAGKAHPGIMDDARRFCMTGRGGVAGLVRPRQVIPGCCAARQQGRPWRNTKSQSG
jgi:hypothetical protein